MLARRMKEVLAMMMIGDGIVALLYPTEHALLWKGGPTLWRDAMEACARRPRLMRSLAALELAAGVWLAGRQNRKQEPLRDEGASTTRYITILRVSAGLEARP